MPTDRSDVSPDRVRFTIDAQVFDVSYDPEQPGAFHYSWVSGPNDGYGFTSRRSDNQRSTVVEHEVVIREFLRSINPETGYIERDDS